MCPPLAQIAYRAAGPGRWMRPYCSRVRVVVGTKTVVVATSVRRAAAVSVMYERGLWPYTSTHSSRGASASGIDRSSEAAE